MLMTTQMLQREQLWLSKMMQLQYEQGYSLQLLPQVEIEQSPLHLELSLVPLAEDDVDYSCRARCDEPVTHDSAL